MSPLQIWNYLGLGRIGKRSFLGLGGLKIILTKFFTVYWILVQHFGTVWSRKIEICNKSFRNTAGLKRSWSICVLWYDLMLFWLIIKCIKSKQNLFFFHYPYRYRLDLSKNITFGPAGQGVAKMQTLKVCACRDSNPGRQKTSNLLC